MVHFSAVSPAVPRYSIIRLLDIGRRIAAFRSMQFPEFCSVFGTKYVAYVTFNRSCATDWSVYAATRKICLIAAFCIGMAGFVSVSAPQSGIQVGITELGRRVDHLELKSEDVLVRMARIDEKLDGVEKSVSRGEQLTVAATGSLMFLVLSKLAEAMGIKIGGRKQ